LCLSPLNAGGVLGLPFPFRMTCAVLSIGTELTRGELANSNGAWLGAELTALGFEVTEHAVVDDDRERIVDALRRLAQRARVIVSTGGLGPTTDDVTTEAVATAVGAPLARDAASLDHIRRRVEKAGRTMSPSNAKQADFPEGADILPNPVGTAPGFGVRLGDCVAFFMPGVPREMKRMFDEQVAPRIRALASNNRFQSRLRIFGLPESVVGEKLDGVEQAFPGTTIGYRAHVPEIEVKVLARAASHSAARDLCERATAEVRARLGAYVYGDADDTFAGVVGRALRARGWTLAIAESCTGGLVGHMLTREPGASDFLLLDAVTYANSAKSRILGVDEETIRWHGAVSPEVAGAMARGARHVSGADVALSLTGVAGPSGGSDTKPVGTVYIALARPDGTTDVAHRVFSGDRAQIQTLASYAGLSMVRDLCASRTAERTGEGSNAGERG
jgi:competence/damage-inducible protein CinA-like protein